jgi:enamine deaminase RidA (YjgF/YER057c/UK114 family)
MDVPKPIEPRSWPDLNWYAETGFSPGVRFGDLVFVSGCSGADRYPDDPQAQVRQAYSYVGEVLAAAGSSWDDVVSMTTYHLDMREHIDDVLEVHREFVTKQPFPAWTAVGVTELYQPDAILEVSVIGRVPAGQ